MRLILLLMILSYLMACKESDLKVPASTSNSSGVIIDSSQWLYNGDTLFSFGNRILFQDSLFVEEIGELKSVTDTSKITREWKEILYYRFTDLRLGKYLHFHHFSDTARPFQSGSYHDSSSLLGGFNFKMDRSFIPIGPIRKLPDTTLSGIKHGSFSVVSTKRNGTFRFVCFYRLNNNSFPLSMVSNLDSLLNGNPVVKIDSYEIENDRFPIGSSAFYYERNHLTKKERMVFSQWQKFLTPD